MGLQHDSRRVASGDLFFALPGSHSDGNKFITEALTRGAIAIVSEQPAPTSTIPVTWIQVDDIAAALGLFADNFFGHPSHAMTVIGVTGTNGKTTTTYLLESIIKSAGGKPGVAGTIDYRLNGKRIAKAINTTPISIELIRLLDQFRQGHATHALMEVSSHSLSLKRVETIDFDAAVFLNLTRDHLDFHKTIDAYFEAKAHLFDLLSARAYFVTLFTDAVQ
jgi:UDP-N-acetylmuramoyl-L-alanyl-D-glutamate--2,6-diaminopimelate ligase